MARPGTGRAAERLPRGGPGAARRWPCAAPGAAAWPPAR